MSLLRKKTAILKHFTALFKEKLLIDLNFRVFMKPNPLWKLTGSGIITEENIKDWG